MYCVIQDLGKTLNLASYLCIHNNKLALQRVRFRFRVSFCELITKYASDRKSCQKMFTWPRTTYHVTVYNTYVY